VHQVIATVECRDLYVVIKISILEEVSSLLEPVIYSTKCGCRGVGALEISLVNEVQCGTGAEWSDLIGQHTPAAQSWTVNGIGMMSCPRSCRRKKLNGLPWSGLEW